MMQSTNRCQKQSNNFVLYWKDYIVSLAGRRKNGWRVRLS